MFAMVTLTELSDMAAIVVIACSLVFIAICLDLVSGLSKAKQRGEMHTSWALKRTIQKFISYEGGMLIAACVDTLIYFSKVFELVGLHLIVGIPIVTCFVGIFLLVVEWISIRENADIKTRKEMERAASLLAQTLEKLDRDKLSSIAEVVAKEREEKRAKEVENG